jgi:hypothetical protein
MCPSTKPHAREKVPRMPPFEDASVPTVTRLTLNAHKRGHEDDKQQ